MLNKLTFISAGLCVFLLAVLFLCSCRYTALTYEGAVKATTELIIDYLSRDEWVSVMDLSDQENFIFTNYEGQTIEGVSGIESLYGVFRKVNNHFGIDYIVKKITKTKANRITVTITCTAITNDPEYKSKTPTPNIEWDMELTFSPRNKFEWQLCKANVTSEQREVMPKEKKKVQRKRYQRVPPKKKKKSSKKSTPSACIMLMTAAHSNSVFIPKQG